MNINEAHREAVLHTKRTILDEQLEPAITAYLAAMEAAGFVMMPAKATAEMGREGSAARNKGALVEGIYAAMVAARPRVTP